MDYGAHLPVIDFGHQPFSLEKLLEYTRVAKSLGFRAIAANDHLVSPRPWLDSPTALAAVIHQSYGMDLITTVALPVVRGPVPMAKTLAAIDILSGGRLTVGLGPGSSDRDYAAVGLDFEERWKRLDEAVLALRALWRKDGAPFLGRFYSTDGIELEPYPAQQSGPPIWIGSWGSEAGMRRVARLADGWLASALHGTPESFSQARDLLQERLVKAGKEPNGFPNALATMWLYITEDRKEAERVIENMVPSDWQGQENFRQRFLVASAEECGQRLDAYAAAGVQRTYLWPIKDEIRQLELFQEKVAPLVR